MKFTAVAIMAALGMADAKKIRSLRKAVPINKDGSVRKLQNEEFEATADYSIYFNTCSSFKVMDDDLFDNGDDNGENNGISKLAQAGLVVSEISAVTFNVLETQYAYYNKGSDENLFVMSLFDWFQAVSADDQREDNKEDYCDACWRSYESCNNNDDAVNQQGENGEQNGENNGDENNGDENNGEDNGENNGEDNGENNGEDNGENEGENNRRRRLSRREFEQNMQEKRRLQQGACQIEVSCDECWAYGCYDEDGDQQDDAVNYCEQDNMSDDCVVSEDDIDGFMQDAACVDTGIVWYDDYYNEYNLKAGFVCDPDGYGVQIAVFLDDDCTLIHTGLNFADLMAGTYTYALFTAVKEDIQKPYQESIDCLACEYVEIQNNDDANQQDNQDENAEAQINEVCQNVVQEALDVYSCGGAEQNDDQNDQQEDDDDVDKSWYEADIVSNDGGEVDEEDICFFVQAHLDELGSYQVLQSSNGGDGNFFFDYSSGKSGGFDLPDMAKYIAIVVGVCIVIIAGVLIGQSFAKKDSKKVPLVGNKNGAMA